MTTIVTRSGKGSALSFAEVDGNFTNLNDYKIETLAASVDSELVLFSGTSGKVVKRGTLSGIIKATAGVVSAAVAGTDYLEPPSGTGVLKANSGGALLEAVAGTDFAKPNTKSTWSVPQRGTITTDNDGSFDLDITNNFKCTPTGAVTLTFTNIALAANQSGQIIFVNTGGYVVSAAATTKINTAALTTISTAGTYVLGYICDGTNVYVSNSLALS